MYLGSRAGGQKVALKVLSATAQQAATLQRLRRETALLQRVSFDANVVQFYGASLQHAADAVLVMECASHLLHDAKHELPARVFVRPRVLQVVVSAPLIANSGSAPTELLVSLAAIVQEPQRLRQFLCRLSCRPLHVAWPLPAGCQQTWSACPQQQCEGGPDAV